MSDSIAAAAEVLADGGVIGLPTETVYGLACDASNRDAVAVIYRIKGRPTDHPLIVHVLDTANARRWAEWPDTAQRLADAFWPGPLTLVLKRRADAPPWACAGHPTIGLRVPAHPVARQLLEQLGARGITGLAAPSANRFGRISPTTAAHVRADLGDAVAVVLDGGDAAVGIESTIVDLSRGFAVLLRPGHIGPDELAAVLGGPVEVPDRDAPDRDAPDRETPRVSGSLPSHYAPLTPLVLVPTADLAQRIRSERAAGHRLVVWSIEPCGAEGVHWFARPATADAMERVLYRTLREFDEAGADRILVEQVPAGPQWAAITDRLTRAAA